MFALFFSVSKNHVEVIMNEVSKSWFTKREVSAFVLPIVCSLALIILVSSSSKLSSFYSSLSGSFASIVAILSCYCNYSWKRITMYKRSTPSISSKMNIWALLPIGPIDTAHLRHPWLSKWAALIMFSTCERCSSGPP